MTTVTRELEDKIEELAMECARAALDNGAKRDPFDALMRGDEDALDDMLGPVSDELYSECVDIFFDHLNACMVRGGTAEIE